MIAGLLIGVIQSLSAYFFGPIYKDVVVYAALRRGPVGAPARPDGKARLMRWGWLAIARGAAALSR